MDTASTSENIAPLQNDGNKSPLYLLKLLLKKWWVFLLIGIAGAVAGFIYASRQKPVYESALTFALDEGGSDGGMSGALGLAAQFGISLGGAKDVFTGDNILEIMMSRRIIEGVLLSVDTFDNKPYTLVEYYLQKIDKAETARRTVDNIHFLPGETRSNFSYAKDSLLNRMYLTFEREYIAAKRPNKKLNIYEVNVVSLDEKFTKKFTDKLIAGTNSFYVDITSKKSRETLEILESRVPEIKNKLNSSISNKAAAQDANLNTAFASAQVPIMREQANTQVYGAAYAEMFKNLEMARFQYLKSIPLMQIIDAADYPMKKNKVSRLKTGIAFAVIGVFIALIAFVFYYYVKITRPAK